MENLKVQLQQDKVCSTCGKQFKSVEAPFLGKVLVADCTCDADRVAIERQHRSIETNMENAHIPARLASLKFETYPGSHVIIDQIKKYLSRPYPGILLLVGSVGRGKSALACATLERLAERGPVRYFYAYDLLTERVTGDTMEVLRSALTPPSIVIDEIGLQLKTPAANEFMERVLIGRHDGMKNTILISNLGAADFKPLIGERAWDRATKDGMVILFEGETFRGGKS